jgi:poly(hydroxyalkanoate) granule-associated protein
MAEEEGGKLFGSLVKKGHSVDKVNRAKVGKALQRVGKIRENARRTLGRFRLPLDTGVAGALHRFGVPSRQEIVTLTKRVEELTRSVERAKAKSRKRTPAKHVAVASAV